MSPRHFTLSLLLAVLATVGSAQSDTLYLRDGTQEVVRLAGIDRRELRVTGEREAAVRAYSLSEVAYLRRGDGSALVFRNARRVDVSADLIAATDQLRYEQGFVARRFYGAGGRELPKRTFEALLTLDDAAMAKYRGADVKRTLAWIAGGAGGFVLGQAAARQMAGDTEGTRAGTPGTFAAGAGLVLGGFVLDRLATRQLRRALTLYTANRQASYGATLTVGPGSLALTF